MIETIYEYLISDDTLNGKVNLGILNNEINNSSITIGLLNINTIDNNLYIAMKDILNEEEISILNTIVSNHDGKDNLILPINIQEDRSKVEGFFQTRGEIISVPANSSYDLIINWPYPIRLLSSSFYPANDGDDVYGVLYENTIIGNITSNVNIGDTEIHVSDSVIQNIQKGFKFILDNGTNSEEFHVSNFNFVTKTITIHTGTTNEYLATSPTYCKMTIAFSYDKVPLNSKHICECGKSSMGGSYIPPNTPLKITYWNNSDTDCNIYIKFEYWY